MRELTKAELKTVSGGAVTGGGTVTCCDDNGNCIEIEVGSSARGCSGMIKIKIGF